jgi:Tol biopolymer transport system component
MAPDAENSIPYERTGNSDIRVITATGGAERAITVDTPYDFSPGWSPDGKFLAFTSWRPEGSQIRLVPAEGWRIANASPRDPLEQFNGLLMVAESIIMGAR